MQKKKVTFFPEEKGGKAIFLVVEFESYEVINDYIFFYPNKKDINDFIMFNLTNVRDIKPFIENKED